ncbi:MAG TPA: hypothetical protein VH372_03085 [Actinospica sp.]|nr:hypothetical protein [Actinospica sp.]
MNSWLDSPFVQTCAAVIGLVTLAAGIDQYRRGERWSLVALLTVPVGSILGIYAGDRHLRELGLVAAALLLTGPVIMNAIRRRHAGGGDTAHGELVR